MKVKDYPKYTVLPDGSVIGARGKKLKEDENSTGYKRVSLCKDGVVNRVFVHRLVAEHFVDNPDNLPCVNHINGDRQDNRAENLEWCTHSYNVLDGWKRGRDSSHLHLNFGR